MRTVNRMFLVLSLILLSLTLTSCASGSSRSSEHDAGEVALCGLNNDLVGWRVTTRGKISFIDLSPPDGVYFEFEDGGCEVGASVHNDFWLDFSDQQQAQITLDNSVEIGGIVTRENSQMMISVQDLIMP